MDSLITAAAQSLAWGDPLGALKRVALREDPPAVALRGIAMAQLGDLARAGELLRRAARAFGPREPIARARCMLAGAEIALASRDLGRAMATLDTARAMLDAHGDVSNAAHAGYLRARLALLVGRLDEAATILDALDVDTLPVASRPGYWLVAAGIAMRRIETASARAALAHAERAARRSGIAAVAAEVARAAQAFAAPAARVVSPHGEQPLGLAGVEALIASDSLLVDACRNTVRAGSFVLRLGTRPVLFAIARVLGEGWPGDATRHTLLTRAFRAREVDESHRARLRVEIGRLRAELRPVADIRATESGFLLRPRTAPRVVVLVPPQDDDHAELLALLADGEGWSSSALALALDVSSRTVQRALDALSRAGKAESFGRGRSCRWVARQVPGFPSSLLLPAPISGG